jgi:hypothetical protein
MALARQEHNVVVDSHGNGIGNGFTPIRYDGKVVPLAPAGAGQSGGDVPQDGITVLRVRIVVGHDREVGSFGSDAAHGGPPVFLPLAD